MAQLERRAARLRRVRARLTREGGLQPEAVPSTPQEHHHIGATQNNYIHIGTFLQKNTGDPAIQVRVASMSGDVFVSDDS